MRMRRDQFAPSPAKEGRSQSKEPAREASVRRPSGVKFMKAVSPVQSGFGARRESWSERNWPLEVLKMRQIKKGSAERNRVRVIRRIRFSFAGLLFKLSQFL